MKKKILAFMLSLAMIAGAGVLPAEAKAGGSTGNQNAESAKVTITFDTMCDVTEEAISVNPGETAGELPQPERREYVFGGWFEDENCETEFTTATAISADKTVYAKWHNKGDIDKNGSVSAEDALMVLKIVANMINEDDLSPLEKKLGKVTSGSENLSAEDALEILKRVAGMISGFDLTYWEKLGFEAVESEDELLAFPGAEGYGKHTVGGRGGEIIYVTNLNDSGEGSLRAAIEAEGPRTVIFRVSGDIMLESNLRIKNPYITIAGETAPGDGICIRNCQLIVNTEQAIVRYIRVRPYSLGSGNERDCIWVNNSTNVVVDHATCSFSTDEALSTSNSTNVTIQDCLIAESIDIGGHGKGSLIRGSNGQKVTYYGNLYAIHRNRMPMSGNYSTINGFDGTSIDLVGWDMEFINNVCYNWMGSASGKCHDVFAITRFNLLYNYYKGGPETDKTTRYMWSEGCSETQMYAEGNTMDGVLPEDQFDLIEIEMEPYKDETTGETLTPEFSMEKYRMTSRCADSITEKIDTAEQAYNNALKDAGCSISRDKFDRAVIDCVKNGTGKVIKKVEKCAGWSYDGYEGWPVLNSTTPYTDEDMDGMDDAWELKVGLDPTNPEDGKATVAGGYTNLEIFLESLK